MFKQVLAAGVAALMLAGAAAAQPEPWWQAETALGERGMLRLDDKPWWPRAQALAVGEQFQLRSELPGGGLMLIRREKAKNPAYGEMIVWILDDDGDMDEGNPVPDRDSDGYVVDYHADGTVDRLLDYMDNDGDNVPEEMDIRYFIDGELRYSWKAFDNDGDGHMWHIGDYEYERPFFLSDAYGDSVIYLNKYDPERGAWAPFSECPFAFWDTDDDGFSERVARFSAVPRDFLTKQDHPDYANSYALIGGPFEESMRDMGTLNVRYSFDIDGLAGPDRPLHYEMGFNMIGDQPYDYPRMNHDNPLRRPPSRTVVLPLEDVPAVCDSYPADETGFSFMEFEDGSIAIGDPARTEADDLRWEGVFWTWHRRPMHNTGGPWQIWNIRREYLPEFRERREVYYSPVDRRLHLKGAHEGWVRIGMIGNEEPLGEIRMFDADGDGYFDRWEHYTAGQALPVRVDQVAGAQNQDFGDDWDAMAAFYQSVLPEAIELNERLIGAIAGLGADWTTAVPENLTRALARELSLTERRYLLDQVRELHYRHFRERALADQQEALDAARSSAGTRTEATETTSRAWELATRLARIDALYGAGRLAEATELINGFAGQ